MGIGTVKKLLSFSMAICVTVLVIAGFTVSGAQSTSNDVQYYEVSYDEVMRNNSPIADWKRQDWFDVEKAPRGVRLKWTNAPRNVRIGNTQLINTDGFHVVFDKLSVRGNARIVITFGEDSHYADYVDNTDHNVMARLPFAMVIDVNDGSVTSYAAKPFTTANKTEITNTLIENNPLLTKANLSGREWSVSFKLIGGAKYRVNIDGVEFDLPVDFIKDSDSALDLSSCYFTLNTWAEGNTFDLDFVSFHGGDFVCADQCTQAQLSRVYAVFEKIEAIGKITSGSKNAIILARNVFNGLDKSLSSLVTNYSKLETAEEVFEVVKSIDDIGTVSSQSKSKIDSAKKLYFDLDDEKKLMVTNYKELFNAMTRLSVINFPSTLTELPENDFSDNNDFENEPEENFEEQPEESVPPAENETASKNNDKTQTVRKTITYNDQNVTGIIWVSVVGGILLAGLAAAVVFVKKSNKKKPAL